MPYSPKNRADVLRLLRLSAEALDQGNMQCAHLLHKWARSYMNSHPDEFPEFPRLSPSPTSSF